MVLWNAADMTGNLATSIDPFAGLTNVTGLGAPLAGGEHCARKDVMEAEHRPRTEAIASSAARLVLCIGRCK
jgi:hypothetical protein